jgi:hypothetical protein
MAALKVQTICGGKQHKFFIVLPTPPIFKHVLTFPEQKHAWQGGSNGDACNSTEQCAFLRLKKFQSSLDFENNIQSDTIVQYY